jgi:hypothetical protein
MKNCGPLRFPAQYPKNIMAITVDFFVKPAILLAASDSINGNAGETAITSQNPASRGNLSVDGRSFTIRIPAIAIKKISTRLIRRDFRIVELKTADRRTVTSWNADAGNPIRIV